MYQVLFLHKTADKNSIVKQKQDDQQQQSSPPPKVEYSPPFPASDSKRSNSWKGWEVFEFKKPLEETKSKTAKKEPLIDFADPFQFCDASETISEREKKKQEEYNVYLEMLKDLDFTEPAAPAGGASEPTPTSRTIFYTAHNKSWTTV